MESGFPRHRSVNSHPSDQIPILQRKICPPFSEFTTTFITEHYETLKQQSKKAVYLLLQREAERRKIPVPSYTTFRNRLKKRPLVEQTRKRKGPRAATQVEEWKPRHG